MFSNVNLDYAFYLGVKVLIHVASPLVGCYDPEDITDVLLD